MLTDNDLDHIRDWVGDEPDDNTIEELFDVQGHWMPTALRVLRRRFTNATAGGQQTTSFSLDGVLSVGMSKADLNALDRLIARLQAMWDEHQGVKAGSRAQVAPIARTDRSR